MSTDIDQTRAVAQLFVDDMKREKSSYWTVRTRPGVTRGCRFFELRRP